MKTKMLKLLTLTLGLAASGVANAAGGDIWEIVPCTVDGTASAYPVASIDDPMGAGETVRFKLRFVRSAAMKLAGRQWKYDYVGSGSSLVDELVNPLKICIYVSGEPRWASYEGYFGAASSDIRDFVFSYKTEVGDFALPIRLSAGGEAIGYESTMASEYDLLNTDKWGIIDEDAVGKKVNAQFRVASTSEVPVPGGRNTDFSMMNLGFYVKTIDFNPSMDEEEVWRTIPSGSKRTTGINVQATAALTNAVTLYVWSQDEDVVKIVGKAPDVTTEHMIVAYEAGVPQYKDVTVGRLKISAGETTAGFSLQAGDATHVNETTTLVLSAFKHFLFNKSNEIEPDYLTAVVKCGEPEPTSVKVECDDVTITADGDYLTAKTALTVSLNNYDFSAPGAESTIVVTVTPSFDADPAKDNWAEYVRFSTADSESILPTGNMPPTVTFDAAHTAPQTLYVYALRSDANTVGTGHQVRFTPSAPAETGITRFTDAGLSITAAKPVVTAPLEGELMTVNAGEELEVSVCVSDTYADLTDTTTGYELKIKIGSRTTTFPGRFFPTGEDNELRDALGNIPVVTIPDAETEGDKPATVTVTSPISNKKSDSRNFTVHVNVQDQVHSNVSLVGKEEGDNEYYESTDDDSVSVNWKVELAKNDGTVAVNPHGTPVFAFLLCEGDYDLTMFGGSDNNLKCIIADKTVAAPDSRGKKLYENGSSVSGSFQVLDGLSAGDGGMNYVFSIAFCTTEYYDPATVIDNEIRPGNGLDIIVWNREPEITTLYFGAGFEPEGDEHLVNNQYPKGQIQKIQPEIMDAGYDLKHGFQYKWTAKRDGKAIATGTVGHAGTGSNLEYPEDTDVNAMFFEYNFPQAGIWTITIQVKDKDMSTFSKNSVYTFVVEILSTPQVSIKAAESYLETDTRSVVNVGLGYYDSDAPIWVKLTVTPPTGANPGRFVLDSQYKMKPDGTVETDPNVYYVPFENALDVPIGISDLDGTLLTGSTKTFSMKAEVVSEEISIDPTKTWAEYYAPYSTKIYIDNVAPVVVGCTEENTNAWKVAGGAATAYPIRWGIRSDVDGDRQGITGFEGIRITFLGCDNATTFFVGPDDETSGMFVPNFGSAQGDQTVTMTIEDKDGGYYTWTYLYMVEPSKFLKTYAHGPSAGTSTSKISQKYERLKNTKDGLGAGHTYVSGAIFSDAENFQLNWNCSKSVYMNVYGFGYKVANPIDNGMLDGGMDKAIDVNGAAIGNTAITNPYVYPTDDERDSFLYCWILTTMDENGAATDTILGETLSPETMGPPAIARVPLPTAQTEDGSYVDTIVEGIFSKERYPEDNLGDINQDGIPDAFAAAGWGDGLESLILSVTGQVAIDGDSVDLAKSNPDGDYLPGVWNQKGEVALVNNAKNSYAPIGHAFTTQREIRGFHQGLNETKLANGVPDFSEDEQKAYTAATGLEYDPATVDLAVWSPEPRGERGAYRMDPTMDDTDGDDLPDGWEYFFWYQAKVWMPAESDQGKPRNGQKYVFERFTPDLSILIGTEIPAEEVLKRFNPCIPLDPTANGYNPDFDRDGLTDLEELAIGTNPCHWDTDGDHMCDGWEVMMSLDPLNGSKAGNPDHDFMAAFTTYGIPYTETTPETAMAFDGKAYLFDYTGALVFDGEGRTIMEQTIPVLYAEPFAAPLAECPVDADGNPIPTAYTYGLPSEVPGAPTTGLEDPRESNLLGFMMSRNYQVFTRTIPAGTQFNMNMPTYILDEESGEIIPDPEAENAFFTFIHDQVLAIFGFDPRTGWNKDAHGYVASRWDPKVNTDLNPFDTTGAAVNTFPYSNYDEYLTMRYRHDFGIVHGDDVAWNPGDAPFATMRGYTTQPTVVFSTEQIQEMISSTNWQNVASTDATNAVKAADIAELLAQAYAEAGSDMGAVMGHGADTDGDGVPDGWELYLGRNPNAGPGLKCETDGMGDDLPADRDGLLWAEEYAGTDSCNAYQSCDSIYRNHPGNSKGWFNKFFPTNPNNVDTDGDGVTDYQEGNSWDGAFANGGMAYLLTQGFSFIYGDPQDSLTCCVRGGGMNPCTVDTDIDGLPDLWEMLYAGVIVDLASRTYAPPPGFEGVAPVLDDATWIADGIYLGGPNAGCYIAGGMDATWAGDGWTDWAEEGNSYDELLGTIRDVDFDHDGLQNWQEYAVQSLRHLRYDDINTPLMGRILKEGRYNMGTLRLAENHSQKFVNYIPMQTGDPDLLATQAVQLYGWDAGDVEQLVANRYGLPGHLYAQGWNMDGWRASGYFAQPINAWDRMITCLQINPYIMLPPTGAAAYCSTSPIMADTDADGMDDFYELFHGLNPLLGSTVPGASDVIANAYGVPLFFNAFWNEWMCPDFSRLYALLMMDIATPGRLTALTGPEGLDPVLYPWTMGAAEVDADGDGLRNYDENLLANMTTPSSTHTDPSPMWFTDSSNPRSFVSQYYVNGGQISAMPFWPIPPPVEPNTVGAVFNWLYAFEENEGYDTDNDWEPDGREIVKTVKPTSDPLNQADPVRRQALYLDGHNSYAMTRTPQFRAADGLDLYTQFTVECWVFPEKSGVAQTIIDRSSFYSPDADNKDNGAIRSNFRIGLLEDGRVYGMFDNTDAIETGVNPPVSCQVVESRDILELNTWSHVALSYDGHDLRLFVNGHLVKSAATSLKPANGVTTVLQNPANTNEFVASVYSQVPSAFFIGARPQKQNVAALYPVLPVPGTESFDNVQEFFQGYVDEVRVWDGARTEYEIANAYPQRFTFDNVATNRFEVYTAWAGGATRNDNDGKPMLPAELCQHYNFANLPGAIASGDVAKLPVGFQTGVLGQVDDPYSTNAEQLDLTDTYADLATLKGTTADDVKIGWWDATKLTSTVYADHHVIPWIENTVAHLPMLDGSTWDSELYHESFGGRYLPAQLQGIQRFVFPNTAVPYTHHVYSLERWHHQHGLERAIETFGEMFAEYGTKYEFEIRSRFTMTSDLVPLGGAYAKTSPALWDGQGPSDAWEYSVVDSDDDGLPDWWEDVAKGYSPADEDVNWNTMVTYDGHSMPAWEAYLRDLAKGMQPDGSVRSEYEAIADGDGDGLPDWWQYIFAIEDGSADSDGDGLSNYVEYMLSEVFDLDLRFDPTDAYSVQSHVSDYFYRLNEVYVGEVFTDHDQVKDQWEQKYMPRTDMVTPYLYDAQVDVTDINEADGWSNYAEYQAGTDPTRLSSLGIDAVTMSEHPVPTIELHLNYEGNQNTAEKGIVVKAWSDPTLESIPDAVWTLGASGTTEMYENGTSNVVNGLKYIGMNPNKELLMHLSPGSVVKGSVEFLFKDLNWKLVNPQQQLYYVMDGKTAVWDSLMIDKERVGDTVKGDIIFKTTEDVVGEIDYDTGAVTIDFTRLPPDVAIVGDITGQHQGEEWLSIYTMAQSYVRAAWLSKTVTGGNRSTYYLSDADQRSAANNSLGHVHEGKNTFIAFVDLDGNGEYSAGEPYGAAFGVDIGWNYGKVSIELTDTHPVSARFCCVDAGGANGASGTGVTGAAGATGSSTGELGLSDREVLYGTESGNLTQDRIAIGAASGGLYERIRVVRTLVDDEDVLDYGLAPRIVLDKLVSVSSERYITEADFLKDGALDIDWDTLADDIKAATRLEGNPITNIAYRVVSGNGTTSNFITNNLLPIVFQRSFDTEDVFLRLKPLLLGPGECNATSPTFSWAITNGLNSYTAFRIEVTGKNGFSWNSGFQPMPARVRDDTWGWRYEWKAPLCVNDKTTGGKVFANNANYSWKITLANAKFKNTENWSAPANFMMNVLTNSLDYGTLKAAVRYYGPKKAAQSGTIRVQVFSTPDFSGTPVASGYVADLADLDSTNKIVEANVLVPGLKAGTYYVRAFIDTEADAKRADWESWGCFSVRDTGSGEIFTPKSVRVGPRAGTSDIVPIYIEDADTDQDGLPDAWEVATKGSLSAVGTEQLDQALVGGFAMKKELSGYINASGRVSQGLAVLTTRTLNSLFMAAMVTGVDANGTAEEVGAALAAVGEEIDAEASKVAIVGFTFDRENRRALIEARTDVEADGVGSNLASAIYTFNPSSRPVYCEVWSKANLADAAGTLVARKEVEFGSTIGTITVDLSDVDLDNNGFFWIELKQD